MSKAEQALRKLTRQESAMHHYLDYIEQIKPDTNHRGACLMQTANVETALDTAITQFLRLDDDSRLLEDENFFSSFSRKIELGYALTIYGRQTKSNLNTIRHIRNAFAHAKIPVTFDTPEVAAVCAQLEILPILAPRVVRKEPIKPDLTPRLLFDEVANALAHNLIIWALEPVQRIDEAAFKLDTEPAYSLYYRRKSPLP
jgi:hypothetical protein